MTPAVEFQQRGPAHREDEAVPQGSRIEQPGGGGPIRLLDEALHAEGAVSVGSARNEVAELRVRMIGADSEEHEVALRSLCQRRGQAQ